MFRIMMTVALSCTGLTLLSGIALTLLRRYGLWAPGSDDDDAPGDANRPWFPVA